MRDHQKINDQRRGKALPALIAVMSALVVALPLSRWLLLRKPPLPPPSASIGVQRRYWQGRIKSDVSDKEAYLKLGQLEERSGFYLAARRSLEAARALGVEDRLVAGPLGRTLSHLAEPERAQAELEKAIALNPGRWEPVANLAGFYVTTNSTSEADKLLTSFWKSADRATLTTLELERLALAFLECSDAQGAFTVAAFLVQKDPKYTGGQILAARCAFAVSDFLAAKTYVEAALKDTPKETAALYFYGLVLNALKDYDGALAAWQKANAIDPSAGDVYERIGQEYGRRGDFKRAAIALERVALADPQPRTAAKVAEAFTRAGMPIDAAYWSAVAAGLQGDYTRALSLGKQAATSPDPVKRRRGLSAMAESYYGLGQKQEYLATVLEATKAGTTDDLVLRARAYELLEQYEPRLRCLAELIQKAPKQEPKLRYDRSQILEKIGRRDEAEQELEKAVALDPESAQFAQDLADTYLKRSSVGDRLEKATRLAEKATTLAPDQEQGWLTLGQCYAAQNRLTDAARSIEHAIDLEAGNGPAYLELSRVYARLGDTVGSKAMMQLYQKYVVFEQERQTLRTRARRKNATASDYIAYADLLMNIGDTATALSQYESAFALTPQDKALKNTLRILYTRMNLPDRLAHLGVAP